MPLYQFFCKKCNHPFEELCSFETTSKIKCPKCKKKAKREITAPRVQFSNPQDSSKWHTSFDYRASNLLESAKAERRSAEEKSHMGSSPYGNLDDISSMGEGIFDAGEK